MNLRLPPLTKFLPSREWAPGTFAVWEAAGEKARRIARTAGEGPGYPAFVRKARALLAKHGDVVPELVGDRRLRKAVLTVWAEDPDIARRTLTWSAFELVVPQAKTPGKRLTMNTSFQLARMYFDHFDLLDTFEAGLFDKLGRFLSGAFAALPTTPLPTVRTALVEHPDLVLGSGAPTAVADRVVAERTSLQDVLKSIGMTEYGAGRFATRAREETYLKQLEAADPRRRHAFLENLKDRELLESPSSDSRLFGHLVLERLARVQSEPHATWQGLALFIGDDPRLAHTANWRKWWGQVDRRLLRNVIGWMSSKELELFLAAVENYGISSGKIDQQRMFPARKAFLQGLLDQKLVRETRLFAGTNARFEIRAQMDANVRPEITTLTGTNSRDLAAIYIDCGSFYVVEGSHSFRLHLYRNQPSDRLTDRSIHRLNDSELRKGIDKAYEAKYRASSYKVIVHNTNATTWLKSVYDFFEHHGIGVDPQKIMDRETYDQYKRRHGLPVVRR